MSDNEQISKDEARYTFGSALRRCGLCEMYLKGKTVHDDGRCTLVEGPINPYGTCRFFERAEIVSRC